MRIPRQEPEKARIEVIPMIDIVFFLLVFFRHYPKQLRHNITLQADHAVSF